MKISLHAYFVLGLLVLAARAGAGSLQDKVVIVIGAGMFLDCWRDI